MAQAQIVYRDALGDDTRPASVLLGGDMGGKVSGGRLARDHTLADVPNHFCRDQIMDYINQMEDEDGKKDVARAAVLEERSVKTLQLVMAIRLLARRRSQWI